MQALGLDAQGHHNICAIECFLDSQCPAHAWLETFQSAWNPHGWTAKRDSNSEFGKQMNIRPSHAAVENVAQDRDVQSFELSNSIANRQRVKQRLGRMLVRA